MPGLLSPVAPLGQPRVLRRAAALPSPPILLTRTSRAQLSGKVLVGSTITASVTVGKAGNGIIASLVYDVTVQSIVSVDWGGAQLAEDRVAVSGFETSVWSLWNLAPGTKTLTVTFTGVGVLYVAGAVDEVGGPNLAPADKSSAATGSSTAPSSNATALTALRDEVFWGIAGTNGPSGDAAGDWQNGFLSGQRVGTTGGVATSNGTVNVGYIEAFNLDTPTALLTNITSRWWAALLVTYKLAEGQPIAPPSVSTTTHVYAPTGVQKVNPATVSGSGQVYVPATVQQTYDPTVVTMLQFTLAAGASPASLGDLNPDTYVASIKVGISSGTAQIVAATVKPPIRLGGSISYLVFGCLGGQTDGTAAWLTAMRMRWTAAGASGVSTITKFPRTSDLQPTGFVVAETAQVSLRPDGQPWTWDDVDAMTNLLVEYDYNIPQTSPLEVDVSEVYAKVYGPIGSPPALVHFRDPEAVPSGGAAPSGNAPARIGAATRSTSIGDITRTTRIGAFDPP
jgi:hypothetical protein